MNPPPNGRPTPPGRPKRLATPPKPTRPPSPEAEAAFLSALERPAGEREAFVAEACAGDKTLVAEVQALLALHRGAGNFLEEPPLTPEIERELARLKPEESGDMIGPYKLREQIGEGGFGAVWVADQEHPVRRRVALKIIKMGMDTKDVIARFEQERQALAMMDHPNIARVFDAGATQFGRPYFVMELVRGVKITKYCDEQQLSTRERIELFITVCQAVQHAHQKGIIHRDLKPSNILVTTNDGEAVPKVIDFGVAKATQGRLTDATVYTEFQQMIGTPLYMSPEQADMTSLDVDTRSDIYSLGVLLYELLTGHTPIARDTLARLGLDEIRRVIREVDPPRPSMRLKTLVGDELTTTAKRRNTDPAKLPGAMRGDIDWIVMKCLEKDRKRRYDTANGLALDLRRHLQNEVITARPPTASYLLGKLIRRNKLAFGAAAAIAVALLLGIVVSTWQMFRATRAEQEQSRLREVAVQAFDGEKTQRTAAENERQRAELNAEKSRAAAIQSRRSQYAADLFAATTQIEKGSFVTARNLLREYFPRDGLEELRGFEWRYWWQLSAGQQLKTIHVGGRVRGLAWSPDGRLIVAATGDGTVELLQAETGERVSALAEKIPHNPSVAFTHDGNGVVVAGSGGEVLLWDVRAGTRKFSLKYRSPSVACSPVEALMAVGTGGDWWAQKGDDVFLVDTNTGKEVRVLPKAGDRAVFSPDGRMLATANAGKYSSGSQAVMLWDVASGQKLHTLGDRRQVLGMAFSPDGRALAIGMRNGEVTLWNLDDDTATTLREKTGDYARTVEFSRDNSHLAVALQSHEVEIWDVREKRLAERLRGHTGEVNAALYSPDGTRLVTACDDGTIRYWDPKPASVQKMVPELAKAAMARVRFSEDSRWLAAPMKNGDIHLADPATPDWTVRRILPGGGYPVAFSKDGSTLLTLARDFKTLSRWNCSSGVRLTSIALKSTNPKWEFLAASGDGDRLALADRTVVEIYDTRTGDLLHPVQLEIDPTSLAFSRDGQFLAIADWKGNNAIWDVAAKRLTRRLVGTGEVVFIRFSPDQTLVATTSWDASIRLWETATGKPVAVLTGHKAGVLGCTFLGDGRTLVSGSDDRTLRFWNLATFHEVASIQLNYAPSYTASSPDGGMLLTNDQGGGLRCWRVPTLAEIDAAEAKAKSESRSP